MTMKTQTFMFLCALLLCRTAHADDIFTLSSGTNIISFSLPASPDASARSGFAFDQTNIQVTVDGVISQDALIFFDGTAGGGLNITGPGSPPLVLYDFGVQLYDTGQYPITSTLFAPTFRLGTFQLKDGGAGLEQYSGAFQIDISSMPAVPITTTPETSSLTLCSTGLFVFVLLAVTRRLQPSTSTR